MSEAISITIAILAVVGLLYTLSSLRSLQKRYGGIIDVEGERDRVAAEKDALESEIAKRRASWERDFAEALRELEELTRELDAARDQSELQSFGLYETHYDFESSSAFKSKLDEVRAQQKAMVRNKTAAVCKTDWQVEGSKAKGRQMVQRYLRLQLRAFNGECDAAVAKVRYSNIAAMEQRVSRSFEALNKLGETQTCAIAPEYLDLKVSELRLAHEYQEKREAEREEQRRIREQMREEERVRREIEKAKSDAEREEQRYVSALEKARQEFSAQEKTRVPTFREESIFCKASLTKHETKERAISRAQLTRSGHVYVISNIGSFGEDVYKIGLTRRLDPADRIRELGDASVPFPFDVHAMIYSEDAPDLEHKLQRSTNVGQPCERRKEFAVSLTDIERPWLRPVHTSGRSRGPKDGRSASGRGSPWTASQAAVRTPRLEQRILWESQSGEFVFRLSDGSPGRRIFRGPSFRQQRP